MPTYPDLPGFTYYPNPELRLRPIHEPLAIESILDVGAGRGGVFDHGYWSGRPMEKREACDVFWLRDCGPGWSGKTGVDVCELTRHYAEKSFDLVQCMECLEHVSDARKALEELCKVARKLVLITSADEASHLGETQEYYEKLNPHQVYVTQPRVEDMRALGFDVRVEENGRRQLIAWRIFGTEDDRTAT